MWVLCYHGIFWSVTINGEDFLMWFAHRAAVLSNWIFRPGRTEIHPAVLGFIVLSGYCIHKSGISISYSSIKSYAVRRFYRIVPVYIAATAVGIFTYDAAFWINSSNAPRILGSFQEIDLWTVLSKLSGIAAWLPSFAPTTGAGNGPLHTVMVEIWLYAFYPVGVWILSRGGWERLAAVVVGVWAGGLVFTWYYGLVYWWNNASFVGFLLYWWIGAAFVGRKIAWQWAILVVVLWMTVTGLAQIGLHYGIFGAEVRKLSLALVFALAIKMLDQSRTTFPLLPSALGQSGYSIYAFHAPVLYVAILAGLWWPVSFALAMGAGIVAYVVLEQPLNRFGHQRSDLIKARRGGRLLRPDNAGSGEKR